MWLGAGGHAAAQATQIEYGSPDQSVWTTRVNARGEPENPLVNLAAEIFTQTGISWRHKTYPAARLFKGLQDGSTQFSMLVRVPVLQECCLWSAKPVASTEIHAYRFGPTTPLTSRNDLVGKRVITIRGYSYAGLRDFIGDEKNRISNQESPTHQAAFRMLANGRADYLIDYSGPAAEVLAAESLADIRSDLLARQDVHLVLNKSYPDAERTMSRLEAVAAKLDIPRILRAPRRASGE